MPESRYLITDVEAAVWTGRPPGTIRRWAHEGRITRHGEGRGQVRFDVRELPMKTITPDGKVVPAEPPGVLSKANVAQEIALCHNHRS